MGCDIHYIREVKENGVWKDIEDWAIDQYEEDEEIVVYSYPKFGSRQYLGRDYYFFGLISKGVRGNSFDISLEPKGIPEDASLNAIDYFDNLHSKTWVTLQELLELREKVLVSHVNVTGMKHAGDLEKLQRTIDSGTPDWRLLYPYCEWTNRSDYVKFSVMVPMAEILMDTLDNMIDIIKGIGEDKETRLLIGFDS